MDTFRCCIALPTEEIFDKDVYYAQVPGCDGSFGVLPGHELLVSLNANSGVVSLHLDKDGKEQEEYLIYHGATQMYNGILTVVAAFGKNVKEIDIEEMEARAQQEKDYVEMLKSKDEDIQDKVEIESSEELIEWCEIQIDYAKKHPN